MKVFQARPNGAPCSLSRQWQPWAALFLLAVMFAQLLGAATHLSAIVDEGFHITSGYEYLRSGQMHLFDEHVPLAKALLAWPLFFVPDLLPPEQAAGWAEGNLIQVAQETVLAYQPIDRVIVACRIPVILLTLILAATVYRWASNWFGPTAGVLALTLLAYDPNTLAHGSLATTDVGAVAFIFWAVWAWARYLHTPRAGRWWTAALLLGLAQGAKLTALLLLPVLGVLALIDAWARTDQDRARALLRRSLTYGGMVVVAALVVWALYLFEVRTSPRFAGASLPLPAASHVERWLRLQDNVAYGRESFLLGQSGMHGWWQYFPVAFAVKTPLPTLLIAGLTLGTLLVPGTKRRRNLADELTLGLFPLLYGAASLTSALNIGYRHLLPVLPFLFVSAGRLISRQSSAVSRQSSAVSRQWRTPIRYSLFAILILWLCVETLLIHPHYLAYFNAIAGGADRGYRFLADSNTDWGQTLKALARCQQRNDLGPVRLSQFTFLDPAVYGVVYEPIAPLRGAPPVLPRRFNPEPGLYAISATTLDGVPLALPATYDWFQHREPLARVGHVMFLYDVGAKSHGWVAQCTVPVVPLSPEVVAEGFGSGSLRRVYFDCEQSWIFPGGGVLAGWYARATPGIDGLRWPGEGEHLEWWPDWVAQLSFPLRSAAGAGVAALSLSYVQPTPGELPAFAVWEWMGAPVAPPATPDAGEVTFDGVLTFLGYQAPPSAQPGTSVDVMTYWRVQALPSRPLSLMLHLSGEDGLPIAVGDGLGVPVEQWLPGDVIVQRHTLEIPSDAPPGLYRVRSGVYWLDDVSRLTANGADHLVVTHIQVEH